MKLVRLTDNKLQELLTRLASEPLPLKTAFKLKGIIKVATEEFNKYEDVRKDALQRHGLKNEDGSMQIDERNNVQFDQDGLRAFAGELNELGQLDVELPTVTLDQLGDKIAISAEDLELLEGIVTES